MENDPNSSEREPGGPESGPGPGPEALYRFGWSFYLWLAIVAAVWLGIREGGFTTALFVSTDPGLPWPTTTVASSLAFDLSLGIGSGLFIVLAWTGLERSVRAAAELSKRLEEMLRGLTLSEALVLALLSSFAEELFFRGAVQGSWPGLAGFAFATVLFALVHGGPGKEFRWWSLFALLAGGLMGVWVMMRGNLTAAIFTHWTVNSIQLARIARSSSETTGSDPS